MAIRGNLQFLPDPDVLTQTLIREPIRPVAKPQAYYLDRDHYDRVRDELAVDDPYATEWETYSRHHPDAILKQARAT